MKFTRQKKVIGVVCFMAMLMMLIIACEKGELPVRKHDPGNVITATVDMDATYKWQLYFDLKTNKVVGKNLKTSWDLGFETSESGYHVVLNAAKFMFARNTNQTDFSLVTDTNGFYYNRKCDVTSGNIDSTAIGNWPAVSSVYIIDRGYNETGLHLGFRKVKLLSVNETHYSVRVANLNGTKDTTLIIKKNKAYNFSFLSFEKYTQPVVEPPKSAWDVVFTQYIHEFYNPYEPYLVTGCLLNRYQTFAVRDNVKSFNEIDFDAVNSYNFSAHLNSIGYGWKLFNGTNYTTDPQINYIIKDHEGIYYKLHFIDFYNQNGVKGNPVWEYQQL